MKNVYLIILGILVLGCSKDNNSFPLSNIDCDKMGNNFVTEDYTYAKSVIDSICLTLPPAPTSNDPIGHESNTISLVEDLNSQCDNISIELICYACLESFPPQSSFRLLIDSLGTEVERYFRLRVPSDDFMTMQF